MVRIMFGKNAVSDINKILLLDDARSKHVADMSSGIECNVLSKVKSHEFFAF